MTAALECGYTACDVGYTAGYRFASELQTIREALVIAHVVLVESSCRGVATPAELSLAVKLVELGITSDKEIR